MTTFTKNTAKYYPWYYGINAINPKAEPKKAVTPAWREAREENKTYTNAEKNYKKY